MLPLRARSEVAVPASTFASLRRILRSDVGPAAALELLHAAGEQAGADIHRGLLAELSPGAGVGEFWDRLAQYMEERGWGTLRHGAVHPGVGLLTSDDWAEASAASEDDGGRSTCAFSVGMLEGLLGQVAGDRVAVIEAECRGRGDPHCAFAFGAEDTLRRLREELRRGRSLDEALAGL